MKTMQKTTRPAMRRPWLAAVLSLLCTGLGHIYCGQFVKGLLLFVVSLSYAPITFWASWNGSTSIVLPIFFTSYAMVLVVYFYAVFDSVLVARRLSGDYQMRDYNHGLVYSLLIFLGLTFPMGVAAQIKSTAFEAFYCPASSMEPTVAKGDRFLVNKRAYRTGEPVYGDVVVFPSPGDRKVNFVKRVIGLPGDRVRVEQNKVFVNGRELTHEAVPEEETVCQDCPTDCTIQYERHGERRHLIMFAARAPQVADYPETEVPQGQCFVLGDNRDRSRDSRAFGFIPLTDVIGRAEYIYFPARSWSRFGKVL